MSNDIEKSRHAALDLLKPVCLSMMQDCTDTNITNFLSALARVRKDVAQEIQPYILFPLQNALHQKKLSESSFSTICVAVDAVLEKTSVETTSTFWDIFNPLVHFLSSSNPGQVSVRLEETKAAVVKSLSILIKSASNSVLNDIYSLPCLPAIGQLVSMLLSLAEIEKSRSLQITSMDCLAIVMQLESKYGSTKEIVLGDFFAFCLPGVSMAMSRIITGDQKQGSEVIRKAMVVWSKAVCLVLSDKNLEQAKTTSLVKAREKMPPVNKDKLQSLMIERNDDWVKTTASKLNILIGQICKLGSHSNWRVRLSLAELSESLLVNCSKSLNESVPKVLENLVALINDEYDKVANKAFSVLKTFSNSQAGSPVECNLLEMLEDNIYNLATSLPRRIRMCDEEEKLPLVNLLKGYIMLLGANVRCVINSSSHLRHLGLALVQILDLDTSDSKILEERATLLDYESETFQGEGHHVWKPKKSFKHFRDDSVLSGLTSICQLLGWFGNVYMLVDCFLDFYHESSVYKLASIFIINEIVSGAGQNGGEKGQHTNERDQIFFQSKSENDSSTLHDVVRMLVDEYVCTVNIHDTPNISCSSSLPSSSSSTSSSSALLLPSSVDPAKTALSIVNYNKEIMLSCLFMEGVGKFAMALGQEFGVFFIKTLYPLVENLGHENIHISSIAYLVLTQICSACGYRSINNLIQDNADYLINSVSLRLRHFNQNHRTPRLLCVMLRYCSEDLLPLVEHSIGEILDTLDDHYTDDLVMFMPVLLELMSAIGRWFPSVAPQESKNTKETNEITSDSMISYLDEFVRLKRRAEGDLSDDEEDCDKERTLEDIEHDFHKLKKENEVQEDEEEKVKECPKHIQVVKEVLSRVKNLLSSHDTRIRIQSLEVLAQGLKDLADHERELLPQIHQMWNGFYPRFQSEEKFVIIKALQTLSVMADVGGSFIQQRVMKDVIPGLAGFMDKQGNISLESRTTYINTASFKLQLAILETLGPLAEKLEMKENNLNRVAKICLPYLSNLQPVKLQKASLSAFTSFTTQDSDAMWLLLCQAYCPVDRYHLPGPEFQPLPKSFQTSTENSYTKNVMEIFDKFEM